MYTERTGRIRREGGQHGAILPEVSGPWGRGIQNHLLTCADRSVEPKVHHGCRVVGDIHRVTRSAVARGHLHGIGARPVHQEGAVRAAILPHITASRNGGIEQHGLARTKGQVGSQIHHGQRRVVHGNGIAGRAVVGCDQNAVVPRCAYDIPGSSGSILPDVTTTRNTGIEHQVLTHTKCGIGPKVHHRKRCNGHIHLIAQDDGAADADIIQSKVIPHTMAAGDPDAEACAGLSWRTGPCIREGAPRPLGTGLHPQTLLHTIDRPVQQGWTLGGQAHGADTQCVGLFRTDVDGIAPHIPTGMHPTGVHH